MSLKIDRVQLEIIVQQDSARQKMIELEKQMKAANRELNKIKKQFGENSQQYQAQAQVVRNLKQQYDDLFDQIGIGHLSMKELANRQRELNAILEAIQPAAEGGQCPHQGAEGHRYRNRTFHQQAG